MGRRYRRSASARTQKYTLPVSTPGSYRTTVPRRGGPQYRSSFYFRRWLFKTARRLIILTVIISICIFLALFTFDKVYGPRLRSNAQRIPTLVQDDLYKHKQPYIKLTKMAPCMPQAVVSIEDERFYQHSGVDTRAIFRAIYVKITRTNEDQGGSTITEQLAKNTIYRDYTSYDLKLREMASAHYIEQAHSKQTILELYLNEIYFGHDAYGIAAASQAYFGIAPDKLTLGECAFLASLPQAPTTYGDNPHGSAEVTRRHTVLDYMARLGYTTQAAAQTAKNTPLHFVFEKH